MDANWGRSSSNALGILVVVIVAVFVGVWWLEDRFGSNVALMVIAAVFGIICFAGGALIMLASQARTLDGITQFTAKDAMIDKFRMQSVLEAARGQSARDKAQAQIDVINEKRVQQLADQYAQARVAKYQIETKQEPAPTRSWYDEDDEIDGAWTVQSWE